MSEENVKDNKEQDTKVIMRKIKEQKDEEKGNMKYNEEEDIEEAEKNFPKTIKMRKNYLK